MHRTVAACLEDGSPRVQNLVLEDIHASFEVHPSGQSARCQPSAGGEVFPGAEVD